MVDYTVDVWCSFSSTPYFGDNALAVVLPVQLSAGELQVMTAATVLYNKALRKDCAWPVVPFTNLQCMHPHLLLHAGWALQLQSWDCVVVLSSCSWAL